MRRSAFWVAAGAALLVIVATEAAASGAGGDQDGHRPDRVEAGLEPGAA